MTTELEKPLPDAVERRGINEWQWRTILSSLWPGASTKSALMAIDYCKARQLDVMKKPCHIVPVEVKVGDRYEWREIIMPGIYELRTTAQRTGLYLGHSTPQYGALVTVGGVSAPEWCAITFYRYHPDTGQRAEYPVRTLFREVVATDKQGKVNARWRRAPVQMLTKCTEAAGLREAFPDEIGGESTEEEMHGQRITVDAEPGESRTPGEPVPVKPDGFDAWRDDLVAVADEGSELFASAWEAAAEAHRVYLMETEPERYELLKAHAATKDQR